jgi:hypothetical protein
LVKYRLREIIDSIEFDELVKMKNDLDAGGFHLKSFVEHKIKEEEKKHDLYCATCSNKIDPSSVNNFTLIFGPDDFRKKATFCGIDCLEYFLKEIKQMKRVVK